MTRRCSAIWSISPSPMRIHKVTRAPFLKLAAFERRFRYPLGKTATFRISHGSDYSLFFRSMGRAVCFVAEKEGRIVGSAGASILKLMRPDGAIRPAVYVGDVKVAPEERGGMVLHGLLSAIDHWAGGLEDAFSVVMEGTSVAPDAYTGRAGIPAFKKLGEIVLWRLNCVRGDAVRAQRVSSVSECFARLNRGSCGHGAGRASLRSRIAPVALRLSDGSACGLLEDTRRAKRLFADDGKEMVSAHLSLFAYREPRGGAALIRAAADLGARKGIPALFVAIPKGRVGELLPHMRGLKISSAPAAVYGSGFRAGYSWNINTSEV